MENTLPSSTKKAFTLIELLIVIAIIGILAGVILVSTSNSNKNARDAKRKSDLNQIATALHTFYASNGSFDMNYVCRGAVAGKGQGYIYQGYNSCPSLSAALVTNGFYSTAIQDPTQTGYNGYMIANCSGNKLALYAKLESPTAATDATITRALAAPYLCQPAYASPSLGGAGSGQGNYAVILE